MRILFRDDSCHAPSFGCVVADSIGFDSDAGTLWFSSADVSWEVNCAEYTANAYIRDAFRCGCVDLSALLFHCVDLDDYEC